MAETADMASEIDLERAQEARREAERALETGFAEGADLAAARRPAPARPCCGSASRSGATARARVAGRRSMADARPFHWEYQARRAAP